MKVLAYADDAALIDYTVDNMTTRLTKIADVDMKVNMDKTLLFTTCVQTKEDHSNGSGGEESGGELQTRL